MLAFICRRAASAHQLIRAALLLAAIAPPAPPFQAHQVAATITFVQSPVDPPIVAIALFRGPLGGPYPTKIGQVPINGALVITDTDMALASGQMYCYVAQALDASAPPVVVATSAASCVTIPAPSSTVSLSVKVIK